MFKLLLLFLLNYSTEFTEGVIEDIGRNIRLEVIIPPKIINITEIQTFNEGGKARVDCRATGKPAPTITWKKTSTGEILSNETDFHGVLYINELIRDETTNYTCEAKNKGGVHFRHIHLNIRTKPEIIEVKNDTAILNGSGLLQCHVYGNPKPSITISKVSPSGLTKNVDELSNITIKTVAHPTKKHTFIVYVNFAHVEFSDYGLYECHVSNELGTSIDIMELSFGHAPIINSQVNQDIKFSWNDRPVNLTCTSEAVPNATVSWYFNDDLLVDKNYPFYKFFGKESPDTLQVTPRMYSLFGVYRCKASNKFGSAEMNVTLIEGSPPSSVKYFDGKATNATSITFQIVDPSKTGGLPIAGYVGQYIMEGQRWEEAKNETWPHGTYYTFHNLQPMQTYEFRFAAFTYFGISKWSPSMLVSTSYPNKPIVENEIAKGLKFAKSDAANKIEVQWRVQPSYSAGIDSSQLKYCIAAESLQGLVPIPCTCIVKTFTVDYALLSYVIEDLFSDTFYLVSIRAHNAVGDGPAWEQFFKTNKLQN